MPLTPNHWRTLRNLVSQRIEAERADQAYRTAEGLAKLQPSLLGYDKAAREGLADARIALDQHIRLMETIGLKEHT